LADFMEALGKFARQEAPMPTFSATP
jgi:hypothetical protein